MSEEINDESNEFLGEIPIENIPITQQYDKNKNKNNKILNNYYKNINKNIIELSNIYPANLFKYNLHASERSLITKLRNEAYAICHTQIPYEYIKRSFNNFKKGFVYYQNKEPIAFCIWKIMNYDGIISTTKEIYIYLICGKKLDYKLLPRILDDVVHYCRKDKISYITLEPANDNLKDYYMKNGFEERYKNKSPLLVLDVNKARIISKKSNVKTRKQKRKN